ncbi:MAG TPA: SurA N-terminal domain-containing protein [Pseudomonas sp.]|uniref:SurA N-terminal domain-containing protein n=1 Tax=Pseudomonas sp. TaxID=306 RepID=UPI002BF7A00C|nr:SurA N-terminal domain-containing protein [Pseudomonas sp.]HTO20595.1 SurA N-terminal domain-containing protein [Pseudomonas sp.]
MLQNIRDNSQGWIAKTIIGLIIVLLALTGFEAIFNSVGNQQTAAEVNGEEISLSELSQAVEMQRRQLAQQFGRDFDTSLIDDNLLRNAALSDLIDRRLLVQAARESDFALSQAALDQIILQTPEFQENGRFSPARFDQVIRQMGYGRLQFRQMLEEEMLIGQLQAAVAGSGFVTEQQVRDFVRLDKQTRDFALYRIKPDAGSATVTDEQVAAYYERNAQRFMTPEEVVIEYVELKKDSFFDQVDIGEEELKSRYQTEIANLAEQRRAAHILIESGGDEALSRIEALRQRLDKGEDFAALAREASEDTGSAADGGDLGFAGPGVYAPEFEAALFALKKGEVSEPVRTEFGWHLIKLLDSQDADVPSFAALKDKLERDLKAEKVEQRFVEAARELENLAFEAADLQQPAQELGLQVRTSEPFGREGGSSGVTANRQVIQQAFGADLLESGANSQALELDAETVIVMRVKEHRQPQRRSLEQVAGEIRATLRGEAAAEAARQQGEALLASLREGQTPAAQERSWQVFEAATRSLEGVEPQVLQALFRMPRPEQAPRFAGVALANGDYVLLRLTGVSEPAQVVDANEVRMYQRFLASRAGQEDFAAYRTRLQRESDIERF